MKEKTINEHITDVLEEFNKSELGMYLRLINNIQGKMDFDIPTVYNDDTVTFTNISSLRENQ